MKENKIYDISVFIEIAKSRSEISAPYISIMTVKEIDIEYS